MRLRWFIRSKVRKLMEQLNKAWNAQKLFLKFYVLSPAGLFEEYRPLGMLGGREAFDNFSQALDIRE
jgi:hypothetical protein